MKLKEIKKKIPKEFYEVLESEGIDELRPSQEKAVKAGVLKGKNLLVCTPTASGKTLVAEFAMVDSIIRNKGKSVYIVPLKALASEKFKDFKRKYGKLMKIAMSIGDIDSKDPQLADYDLIIVTSEKLDSLIRHHSPWINSIHTVVVDEIHLINDPGRGPTLEILLTMLRRILKNMQVIGLSATIGNPDQLSEWLNAELVIDDWRPVELKKGVYLQGKIEFQEE